VLGAAAAAAGGNSALAGAVAAGGTEASAAALSEWLYGKQPEDLDASQKATVSAIAGLAGDIAGGVAGKSPADVAEGGLAAHAAVDQNQEARDPYREEREAEEWPVFQELLDARADALIRAINAHGGNYSEIRDPSQPNYYSQADIYRLEDTLRTYDPNNPLLQTWANLSPMSTIDKFESIGKYGTFITPLSTFEAVIGKIDPAATEITISPEQARELELVLGKDPGTLEETNKLSVLDDISWRSMRSPTEGNERFQGPGKGLPKGASELVIDSIPSAGGSGIRQIVIKVGK
jgi:hypothetical protein